MSVTPLMLVKKIWLLFSYPAKTNDDSNTAITVKNINGFLLRHSKVLMSIIHSGADGHTKKFVPAVP